MNSEELKEIKKGIIEYSSNTLNMEKEREKRLYNTANSILTCISILLVATMSLLFELLKNLQNTKYLLIIFGSILILLLLSSLFFSLKAHWFYKKDYTRTGQEMINYINSNSSFNSDDFLNQKINDIDIIYKSLDKNNNLRLNSLKISSILLYIFLGLILIFGIVILIIEI